MRKYIVLALLATLLLTGCAVQGEPDASTTASTTEPQPLGYYIESSDLEIETNGAVRLYALPAGGYRWLSAIGDQLLLASKGEAANVTVLTGAECIPTAETTVDADLITGNCRALYNGFAYYDEAENQAIFLDPQLHEVDRLTLPEDIQGLPLFSPDGREIFYCAGQQIRSFDVERKISRLIKTHSYINIELLGCYFEGQLLCCRAEDDKDGVMTVYMSAQTGETTHKDRYVADIRTYENDFFAIRMDGVVKQHIIGTRDGAAQQLHVDADTVIGAPELHGVVACGKEDNGISLSFYDTASGRKSAAISIPGVNVPEHFYADRWSGCVWMITSRMDSEEQLLLRWSIKDSAVEEDAVYIGTLYTSANPDKEGLDACDDRVSAINKTHGVRIRIWNDGVKYPGPYSLTPEFQPSAIHQMLDALEPVLAEFPKGFLQKSISSRIRICIVRNVDNETKAVQYWDENDAFIALSPGVDVRTEFLKGVGYVVDSHVRGNSSKFDAWESMNPEGFIYGTVNTALLSGDARAFVDEASMATAVDDRSSILLQAMQPDNAQMFQPEIMQKKLTLICQAIRDAWNLERNEETYPWEQYLTESIAYKK